METQGIACSSGTSLVGKTSRLISCRSEATRQSSKIFLASDRNKQDTGTVNKYPLAEHVYHTNHMINFDNIKSPSQLIYVPRQNSQRGD